MTKPTYSKPSEVTADGGRVQMDGPGEVDVAFTPEAAEETARRLARAAGSARGQVPDVDAGENGASLGGSGQEG